MNIQEYAELILLKAPMLSLLVIKEKHMEFSAQNKVDYFSF